MLQVTLTDHRVLFRTYPYTFTTDEAAKVMESLVFIHLDRHPDPLDPSRQIATRTTTTFSMNYTTAKNLIQHFLSARLIMNATDPSNLNVRDRGLWCPTLKGKYVLEEFTDSTQVEMTENLITALNAPYMSPGSLGSTGSRLVHLDRLTNNDDQITFSRPNMTIAFKAMMSSLPHDALLVDEVSGINKKDIPAYQHTFIGLHCIDWLLERLTVTSRAEAITVAEEFVLFGWIALVMDKSDKDLCARDEAMYFKDSKRAIYYLTERGCTVIGWKQSKSKSQRTNISLNSGEAIALVDSSIESDSSSLKKATMRKVVVINSEKSNKRVEVATASVDSAKYDFYLSNPESLSSIDISQHGSSSDIVFSSIATAATEEEIILSETTTNNEPTQPRVTPRPSSMALTDSNRSHTSTVNSVNPDNSQHTRLNQILESPLLRLYFRDFLRTNYCVENINFWVDYQTLLKNSEKKSVLEQLSECYSIYETYLGPAADLNIDSTLCQDIMKYVASVFMLVNQVPKKGTYFMLLPHNINGKNQHKATKLATRLLLMPPQGNSNAKQRIVTIRGTTTDKCLSKLLHMFDKVNDHVFGMMAEDSLPKFVKTVVYKDLMTKRKRQEELQDIESDDGYDEDDELDSDEDEITPNVTALFDQRISVEIHRNFPLESIS